MLLRISHTTEYRYAEPVGYALQRLRLTPRGNQMQKVHSWQTEVQGAAIEARYDDQYENIVELVSVSNQSRLICVTASGVVETFDKAGVYGVHRAYMPLWVYQRETALSKAGKAVRDLARDLEANEPLEQMHELKSAIFGAMRFDPGSTHSETPAETALTARHGVCQDYAHVFVAAARYLGFPARYVSGYLLMEDRTEQVASHAWAEAHVEGLGWVGFDPANDMSPDERYVRVACGLDYRDAAPVSGIRAGLSKEALAVSITVEQ